MQVFLSWSGERSKRVAEALRDWLPVVIQVVEPWLSESDIDKGARWGDDISDRLEVSRVGIVCLTSDNLNAPWILFEAGALAKTKDARVCPFLLDVKKADVGQPLGQFQLTLFEKDDVKRLIGTIARRVKDTGEKAPSDEVIGASFERFWGDLETRLEAAKALKISAGAPARTPEELLEEILVTVRRLEGERQAELRAQVSREYEFRQELQHEMLLRHLTEQQHEATRALNVLDKEVLKRLREVEKKRDEGGK